MRIPPWKRGRVRAQFCVLAIMGVSAPAGADEPVKSWFQQITINAFASISYTWNFNDPADNLNQLRAFDYDHNSLRVDGAELVLQKAVVNRGDFGFRFDLAFGAVAHIAAARGLFRDPKTGVAGDFDLQQVYASYIAPLGHGLRLDVGKFVTPVGAEFIEGYDGYNDNFSRSLLFTYAIPFTHTGLRLSYPFNDHLTAMVMVVNGWDNVLDNNAAKSFGVALIITPVAPLCFYVNYIGGPERDNDNHDFRHLIDVGAVWKATGRLTFTVNADWGFDPNAVPLPVPVTTLPSSLPAVVPADAGTDTATVAAKNGQWVGAAAYLRAQLTHRFALSGRGEIFWDVDGYRTGTQQRVLEGTITPELRVTDGLLFRAEFRIDSSDHSVFVRSDGLTRHYQPTVALDAIYVF
jgi:hypothetical protein